MTALVIPGTSEAYVAQSRWVARCSGYPFFCSSAADVFPDVTAGFICADCGQATEVLWPEPQSMVEGVERLLMMRPNPNNRNWEPGETLTDLVCENALHGILDGLQIGSGVTPLAVTDTEIRTDNLPGPRLELHAGRH